MLATAGAMPSGLIAVLLILLAARTALMLGAALAVLSGSRRPARAGRAGGLARVRVRVDGKEVRRERHA